MASGDVLPPSNLPGLAVPWGRQVQNLSEETAKKAEVLQLSLAGLNRTTAASLQSLGKQLERLIETTETAVVSYTVTGADQSLASFTAPAWASQAIVSAEAYYVSGTSTPSQDVEFIPSFTVPPDYSGLKDATSFYTLSAANLVFEGTGFRAVVPSPGEGNPLYCIVRRTQYDPGSSTVVLRVIITVTWLA